MRSILTWPSARWSWVAGLGVIGALAAAPASAQDAAAQQEQAQPQQQQAAPARSFVSDAGMIFNFIKPDKTADFELVMSKVKEALAKSEDPVRRQQAASWKVFKSVEPAVNNNVLYIFWTDPAVKGGDYTISKILSEALPYEEVVELYKQYSEAYAQGQNIVNLQLVTDFAGGAAAPAPAPAPDSAPAPAPDSAPASDPTPPPGSGQLH